MRILWTHNFDPDNPAKGVFMRTAAEGLSARGIEVQLEYLGNLRSPAQLLRARTHVRSMASSFDLVHAQFGSACAWATSFAEGAHRLLSLRGSDWHTFDSTRGFLYYHTRLASRLTKMTLRAYDRILVESQRMAAEVAEFAPYAQIAVVTAPVDLERFVPCDRRAAKARQGFPDCSEKWILFTSVNARNPIKRSKLAHRAFELAQARRGNLRLRLATDIDPRSMPQFVSACDLVLCTSVYEGWPNSVKEALACDVPFVATDVSDLRDIARNDSRCRVCPPDAEAIADSICQVLDGPSPTGLRRHVEHMSMPVISERLIATYQELLEC